VIVDLDQLAVDLDGLLETNLGCCLHIVVEDLNIRDGDLRFCEGIARERGHTQCERLARTFRETIPEDVRHAFLGVRVEEDEHGGTYTHHVTPWRGS
jgi:hypothetical protein